MSDFSAVPVAPGLAALTAGKHLLLVDVWGVLHNGITAHAAAGEALTQFRARGGTVILVSNAPRASDLVIGFLDGMGVPRSAYDGVVTSGDVARHVLSQAPERTLHYIGPPRDRSVFAGLPLQETDVAQAELVLCAGLEDDENETAADYDARLSACRARNLTMICSNPDLIVERGAKLVWCAGAIAERYQKIGGQVIWTGKPHRIIYEAAIDMARQTRNTEISAAQMMAIGDALRTDVAGARTLGIDVLMTADGIHGHDLLDERRFVDAAKAAAFFASTPLR
ncbi:MAG: TIGR01459 family HAD-type hydrolase, partial [Beijerinckiaceae bacterium]